MASAAVSRESAYITFSSDTNGLAVKIETARLNIRSITSEDYSQYIALFGDSSVMEKYASAAAKTTDYVHARIDGWVKRWRDSDPFSGLAVLRKDNREFIGHVILGHGNSPGESELSYLFHQANWNQGYERETVMAVVRAYAPETVCKKFATLDGSVLTKIVATARPDDPDSIRIMSEVGMNLIGTEEKYGILRNRYSLDV